MRLYASGLKYMFLVGGFAESPILQREIRTAFGAKLKILIPQDVALTVLKGLLVWNTVYIELCICAAVLFCLTPCLTNPRRNRNSPCNATAYILTF